MVKALFSPKGGIAPEIMKAIGKATSSVKVAAFAFNENVAGILRAHEMLVDVVVIQFVHVLVSRETLRATRFAF